MAKTLNNCSVIKNYTMIGVKKPLQENGICTGYNTKYYQINEKFEKCDKCKFNIKNNNG